MANIPAFQASDESSILSARTNNKTAHRVQFYYWYALRTEPPTPY